MNALKMINYIVSYDTIKSQLRLNINKLALLPVLAMNTCFVEDFDD